MIMSQSIMKKRRLEISESPVPSPTHPCCTLVNLHSPQAKFYWGHLRESSRVRPYLELPKNVGQALSWARSATDAEVEDIHYPAARPLFSQPWRRMSGTSPPEPHARSLRPTPSRGSRPTSNFLRSELFGLARYNPSRSAGDTLSAAKGPDVGNLWTGMVHQKRCWRP